MKALKKISFRSNLKKMDVVLFFLMVIFTIFGLIMIYSASNVSAVLRYKVSSYYFFRRQLIFMLLTFGVGITIILNTKLSRYRNIVTLLVPGIIALLLLVFSYGIIVNGSKSWIDIFGIRIQPSEFSKTIMILYFAYFYGYHREIKGKFNFMIPLIFALILVVLVAAQPDLGTAIIIAGIAGGTFLAIPLGKETKYKLIKILGIGAVIFAMVFIYSGSSILTESQSKRFTFKDPCSRYSEDTGYQVCNGFIAITNGGLFGVGLGNSTQKYLYLPEAHTDFIFPIISEELGSIVGCIVILTYGFMLFRILKIAKKATTLYGSIICYGTFCMMVIHIFINLLGVLALIPLTGVSLPFLSYGSSFNMNIMILLFLVQRVAIETKKDNERMEVSNIK